MIAGIREQERDEAYLEAVRVSVEPGRTYKFKGVRGQPAADGRPRWRFEPCDCFCVGVSRRVECGQEQVVFSPLSGRWQGELFNCTLRYWADHFEQPLLEEVATAPKRKVPKAKEGPGW